MILHIISAVNTARNIWDTDGRQGWQGRFCNW
jgi:hypothetical protein